MLPFLLITRVRLSDMNTQDSADLNEACNLSTSDAVLALFQNEPALRLTFGQIASRLDGKHPDLSGAVESLVESGLLYRAAGKRYALPEELGIFSGIIRIRPSGNGFLKAGEERIEIDSRNISGALNGDTVMVRRFESRTHGNMCSGKVESVLERSRKGLSGVVRKAGRGWIIDPVDPSLPRRIPLKSESGSDISEGRIAFALLDYSGRKLRAFAAADIGSSDSPSALVDSVVLDHALPDEFSDNVLDKAAGLASEPWSIDGRIDFRDLYTITIDPVDARDFDDAISIRTVDGLRELHVHIADVALYVTGNSALDTEARLRGTSVYLPDRVIPMLPESLSNGVCSLRPLEDRPTRTVIMKFDEAGERVDFSIVPSVIRSDRRMTYEEAYEYMNGTGSDPELKDLFGILGGLSDDLDRVRDARGTLDLGSSEYRVEFASDGWPSGFRHIVSDSAHRLIENFMIEANRAVADHCMWSNLSVLFRVHDEPVEKSEERLAEQLYSLGVKLPGGRIHNTAVLRRILDGLQDSPLRDLAVEYILRSLQKAVYSPSNTGHFGLALRSYMHFTSPIRRYPDLLVHQVLSMQERGIIPAVDGDIAELASGASNSELNAERAEREADELMGLLYLSRRTGNVYDGVVTGVKRFGIFVRLAGVPAEGLAPASEIRRAGIPFNDLSGPFREGSSVKVEVVSVEPLERKLTLRPVKSGEK